LDYRLEIASKAANSEIINLNKTDVIQEIRDRTEGRGADVCVDAVGMEAHRSTWEKFSNFMHGQTGTLNVIKLCASAVRRGGVISVVGVYGSPYNNFPFGQIFDKGVTIRTGQALVQHYIEELLELVKTRKVILNDIITHTLSLEQAAYAYDIFLKKKDNCLKVILKPGR
jgi:alcohol dehydrogenase